MTNFIQPIYLPSVRLHRFLIYLILASLLQMTSLLPKPLFLVLLQISACCVLMAVYQLWEWLRLTGYEEFSLEADSFLYKNKGETNRIAFADIAITFLYYSTLDKMKGSATLCIRLKTGKTFRFCGVLQVDSVLSQIKIEAQ